MTRIGLIWAVLLVWIPGFAQKALVVVAPEKFMDSEYKNTVKALKKAHVEVSCATIHGRTAKGSYGLRLKCEVDLEKDQVKGYNALVFIGGAGVPVFFNNKPTLEVIKRFWKEGKVVAAICWAPAILARAGIVRGKKVTSWRGAKKDLKKAGAIWMRKLVVVDGRLVTGSGPAAARAFGRAVARLLEGVKR